MTVAATRAQLLGYRVRAQQIDRGWGSGTLEDSALLDAGAQDTGSDGGRWALAIRGADLTRSDPAADVLTSAWTLRGAPHLYRRADLASVAAAVQPFSDADAGKRVYSAAKPLKAAGIGPLVALDTVAAAMRSVVTEPMAKGEVSTRVTPLLDAPYAGYCRPCGATHVHEMLFRLAALRGGLELRPGTSPPVLRRVPGSDTSTEARPAHDVIRCYLRMYGPATPKYVAGFLDAPVRDVTARWPADTIEVTLDGERRWLLAADTDALAAGPARVVRLLGPYDPYLQTKDRPLLVADPKRAKALWPVLGRPGAVLVDGEIVGMWRPRASGKKLKVNVELWDRVSASTRQELMEQAELLAMSRAVALSGVDITG